MDYMTNTSKSSKMTLPITTRLGLSCTHKVTMLGQMIL